MARRRDWTSARLTEGLGEETLNDLAETLLHLKDKLTTDFAGDTHVAAAGE